MKWTSEREGRKKKVLTADEKQSGRLLGWMMRVRQRIPFTGISESRSSGDGGSGGGGRVYLGGW